MITPTKHKSYMPSWFGVTVLAACLALVGWGVAVLVTNGQTPSQYAEELEMGASIWVGLIAYVWMCIHLGEKTLLLRGTDKISWIVRILAATAVLLAISGTGVLFALTLGVLS
jgi:hypothetical protein